MIENYTIEDLKSKNKLILTEPLSNDKIFLLNNIKNNINIKEIEFCYNDYNNIDMIINYVNSINNNIMFKKWIRDFDDYCINDLLIIRQPKLLTIYLGLPNTKIINLEKLLYLEQLLDLLVEDINESNLSQMEKYICIYRIVTKFKEYKEEPHGADINLSRNLYDILENEYMVCVGYATLLKNLAKRIGINMIDYTIYINEDEAYIAHKRNLFYIEDKKYNTKGIYISDSCWDSNYNKDILVHAFLTEEEVENENIILEKNWCKILNSKSFEDFTKELQTKNVIFNLLYLLKNLLNKDYNYLNNKYSLNVNLNECNILLSNQKFIEDLYHIIKMISNNKINQDIIMKCNREVDKYVYSDISKNTLNFLEKERINENKKIFRKSFIKKLNFK